MVGGRRCDARRGRPTHLLLREIVTVLEPSLDARARVSHGAEMVPVPLQASAEGRVSGRAKGGRRAAKAHLDRLKLVRARAAALSLEGWAGGRIVRLARP